MARSPLWYQESYEMPEGDLSGVEEERAEAEKAVEGSSAPNQKSPWCVVSGTFVRPSEQPPPPCGW